MASYDAPAEMGGNQLQIEDVRLETTRNLTLRKGIPIFLFVTLFFISFIGNGATLSQYIENRVIKDHTLGIMNLQRVENYCAVNRTSLMMQMEMKLYKLSSQLLANSRLCTGIPNILVVFIYGGIADAYGRKTVLFMTTGGLLVSNIIDTIFIFKDLPYVAHYVSAVIMGITGSAAATTAALITIIVGSCQKGKRMLLFFATYEGFMGLGKSLGERATDWMIHSMEYGKTMIVFTALGVAAGICLFFIQEVQMRGHDEDRSTCSRIFGACRSIFLHTKKRTICLLLILACLILIGIAKSGNSGVTTLLLRTKPFCWTKGHIGIYNMVSLIGFMIGAVLTVAVVKMRLSVHNYILLSFVSAFLMYLLKGISTGLASPTCNAVVIVGAVAGISSALATIIMRFICVRMVPEHELGSLYGLMAISDAISFSFGSSIMIKIMYDSMTISKGFAMYIASVFIFASMLLMTIFRCICKGAAHHSHE